MKENQQYVQKPLNREHFSELNELESVIGHVCGLIKITRK